MIKSNSRILTTFAIKIIINKQHTQEGGIAKMIHKTRDFCTSLEFLLYSHIYSLYKGKIGFPLLHMAPTYTLASKPRAFFYKFSP